MDSVEENEGSEKFSRWLLRYCEDNGDKISEPFVLDDSRNLGLPHLLMGIMLNATEKDLNVAVDGLQSALTRMCLTQSLVSMRTIAAAIAQSEFEPAAGCICTATRKLLVQCSVWKLTNAKKAEAFYALDTMAGAISTLALLNNEVAMRTARQFLKEDSLAPFASTFFLPVALHGIADWPTHFERLIEQSIRKDVMFDTKFHSVTEFRLERDNMVSVAHFDVNYAVTTFLCVVLQTENSFNEVYSVALSAISGGAKLKNAYLMLLRLEVDGVLLRNSEENVDYIFVNPNKWLPDGKEFKDYAASYLRYSDTRAAHASPWSNRQKSESDNFTPAGRQIEALL